MPPVLLPSADCLRLADRVRLLRTTHNKIGHFRNILHSQTTTDAMAAATLAAAAVSLAAETCHHVLPCRASAFVCRATLEFYEGILCLICLLW